MSEAGVVCGEVVVVGGAGETMVLSGAFLAWWGTWGAGGGGWGGQVEGWVAGGYALVCLHQIPTLTCDTIILRVTL